MVLRWWVRVLVGRLLRGELPNLVVGEREGCDVVVRDEKESVIYHEL